MIFAFLFGLSMDYEVFIVTRIREAYDDTKRHQAGDRARPRADGQARDERGARAGVRVLLAVDRARAGHQAVRDRPRGRRADRRDADPGACSFPSLMMLLGKWNWWFPEPVRKVLLVRRRARARSRLESPHYTAESGSDLGILVALLVARTSGAPAARLAGPCSRPASRGADHSHAAARLRRRGAEPARAARRGRGGARVRPPGRRLRRVVPRLERPEPAGEAEDHAPDVGDAHLRSERAGREGGADRRPVREAALPADGDRGRPRPARRSAATSSTARSRRSRRGCRTPSACSRPTTRRRPRSTCCARSRRAASQTSARSTRGRRSSSPTRPRASATSRSPTRSSGRWPS